MPGAAVSSPTGGNPVSTTFSWTPTADQVGRYFICFAAVDQLNAMSGSTCVVINIGVLPLAPVVYSLDPAYGYSQDYTTIQVYGNYPSMGLVQCEIATGLYTGTFVTHSEVLCIAPPVPQATTVEVEVSCFCDIFTTQNRLFEYYDSMSICDMGLMYIAPPTPLFVNPSTGPEYANTLITVLGNGFLDTRRNTCKFNTIVTPATYINTNAVECVSPADMLSAVNVTVSNEGVHYSTESVIYRFQGMYCNDDSD